MKKFVVGSILKGVSSYGFGYWTGTLAGPGLVTVMNQDKKKWAILLDLLMFLVGMYVFMYGVLFKVIIPGIDFIMDVFFDDEDLIEEETETEAE